jgi:16S rRNA (adenine1518-N6/adenine1519-N6)-dimethyltransferase
MLAVLYAFDHEAATHDRLQTYFDSTTIHAFPESSGVRLKKHLGQHILRDRAILAAIVDAAAVGPRDRVLEIGPGPGTLTAVLAERAAEVLAVELDTAFRADLGRLAERHPSLRVHFGDVLEIDLPTLLDGGLWKCVANIPYYITSPLVARLLDERGRFSLLALLMQKEVAERIDARRGRDVGPLSYFVQYHARTRVALTVPAAAFTPPPKVESALLVLEPRERPLVDVAYERIRPIVVAAFAARRKMLRGSLRGLPGMDPARLEGWLRAAGVPPEARPEELSLEDFGRLAATRPGATKVLPE